MDGATYVRDGLVCLQEQTNRLIDELGALSEERWRAATNCPPWDVQMLAAHLVRGGESFVAGLERGMQGILALPLTAEERLKRTEAIAAQDRDRILEDLRKVSGQFEATVTGLMPDRLDLLGGHSYGPRSATWFVQQRMAEVVFHLWDLRVSLGLGRDFDDALARWMLPMLVESNLPIYYQKNRAAGETLGLAVEDDKDLAWTVQFQPDEVTVASGVDQAAATVSGSADALALFVYGREPLATLEQEGRLRVSGPRGLADAFRDVFRAP